MIAHVVGWRASMAVTPSATARASRSLPLLEKRRGELDPEERVHRVGGRDLPEALGPTAVGERLLEGIDLAEVQVRLERMHCVQAWAVREGSGGRPRPAVAVCGMPQDAQIGRPRVVVGLVRERDPRGPTRPFALGVARRDARVHQESNLARGLAALEPPDIHLMCAPCEAELPRVLCKRQHHGRIDR